MFLFNKIGSRDKKAGVAPSPLTGGAEPTSSETANNDAASLSGVGVAPVEPVNNDAASLAGAGVASVEPVKNDAASHSGVGVAPVETANNDAASHSGVGVAPVEPVNNDAASLYIIDEAANESKASAEKGALLREILETATALRQDFDVKFKFDKKKEEQVDRLYEECKAYRDDIFWSLKKELILDVVREIDEIEKRAARFEGEERTAEWGEKLLKFVRETAENLRFALEQHDVYSYRAPAGSRFDPSRQRALETKPTNDEALDKTVEPLRSGFDYEASDGKKRNVRREIVYVYKYEPPKEDDKTSTGEAAEAVAPVVLDEAKEEAAAAPVETTASNESETNDR